ncbi:uncharacterized protein FFE2_16083 [Fusarium fujikuroi]|nr:uncharacterized protein FFE2_16083 [Fusarium fujikuroi]
MAGAHFYLSQAQSSLQATTAQQIQFYDYWIYGKSIHNEKIERVFWKNYS